MLGAAVSALAGNALAQSQPAVQPAANAPPLEPAATPRRAVIQPEAIDKTVAGVALVFGTEPSTLGLQGNLLRASARD